MMDKEKSKRMGVGWGERVLEREEGAEAEKHVYQWWAGGTSKISPLEELPARRRSRFPHGSLTRTRVEHVILKHAADFSLPGSTFTERAHPPCFLPHAWYLLFTAV